MTQQSEQMTMVTMSRRQLHMFAGMAISKIERTDDELYLIVSFTSKSKWRRAVDRRYPMSDVRGFMEGGAEDGAYAFVFTDYPIMRMVGSFVNENGWIVITDSENRDHLLLPATDDQTIISIEDVLEEEEAEENVDYISDANVEILDDHRQPGQRPGDEYDGGSEDDTGPVDDEGVSEFAVEEYEDQRVAPRGRTSRQQSPQKNMLPTRVNRQAPSKQTGKQTGKRTTYRF